MKKDGMIILRAAFSSCKFCCRVKILLDFEVGSVPRARGADTIDDTRKSVWLYRFAKYWSRVNDAYSLVIFSHKDVSEKALHQRILSYKFDSSLDWKWNTQRSENIS